jgi:hypothetical protein
MECLEFFSPFFATGTPSVSSQFLSVFANLQIAMAVSGKAQPLELITKSCLFLGV